MAILWRPNMISVQAQIKKILLPLLLILIAATASSQRIGRKPPVKLAGTKRVSTQLTNFIKFVNEANAEFIFPAGFKEIYPVNSSDYSFDYAMEMPGHDFEIWFRVRSQKRVLADYQRLNIDTAKVVANTDSLYNLTGIHLLQAFTGGQNFFTTVIPPDYLARYNADEGKTYLLELPDTRETKHYKYALLISLHKDRVGTIVAVCFSNEKGAEFFKNIGKASKCLKFKS